MTVVSMRDVDRVNEARRRNQYRDVYRDEFCPMCDEWVGSLLRHEIDFHGTPRFR